MIGYDADEVRLRVKNIIEAWPEGTATLVVGRHLKLQVKGKALGWFMEDHHGDGRLAVNCKALPGTSLALVEANPAVYHIPKYVGHNGWVGIWLDGPDVDWEEVEALLFEAYKLAAPKSVLKLQGIG